MYSHSSSSFTSSHDQFSIFRQTWMPQEEPKRVIVIQHGFGEHSGRYGNVLDAFVGTGTAFFALDSRGHGRTGGKRGHVDQFQMYVDDLADLIALSRQETGHAKVVLLGHSLGGVIAAQYALQATHQESLQGLVLSSPGLMIKMDLAKTLKKAMGMPLARFFPEVTVDAGLELKFLSHDPAVIAAYQADPLVHGKISFQMASNLFNVGEAIFAKAHQLRIPVYVFHGVDDGIVDANGSKILFEKIESNHKELHLFPGLYHETMNEASPHKEEVLARLKDWVLAL